MDVRPAAAPAVVLIAGGTASGKTTIVSSLVKHLEAYRPALIPLDNYYLPLSHLSAEEREKVNFDHPRQFEIELLERHLRSLIAGDSVAMPAYDYVIHDRVGSSVVAPSPLIFVDGIMSLHYEGLRSLSTFNVYVDVEDSLRYERRMKRDVGERGRTPESVARWWEERVHPMHCEFCGPSRSHAHLIVNGCQDPQSSIGEIVTAMRERGLLD